MAARIRIQNDKVRAFMASIESHAECSIESFDSLLLRSFLLRSFLVGSTPLISLFKIFIEIA